MVPKWQNVTRGEYIMRKAAAYIAFCKRQDDKSLFTKKLRQHKYASTLVGTAGQKNGRYERYILEAVQEILSSDESTNNATEHFMEKIRIRLENRQERLNELNTIFETDETAKNLKMGPVKHEYRTAGADGVLSGIQLQETEHSAKPVPPFPFLKEDLLSTNEDKERLNDIWEWSRSINCRKKVSTNDDSKCAICKEVLINSDHLVRCHHCKTPAHESCIATHSTGWAENESNTF
jgi:hypothetical protein